jgi:hypothetical protein
MYLPAGHLHRLLALRDFLLAHSQDLPSVDRVEVSGQIQFVLAVLARTRGGQVLTFTSVVSSSVVYLLVAVIAVHSEPEVAMYLPTGHLH